MGRHAHGKSPAITQMRSWHNSMARLVAAGKRPNEIARIFGMTDGHIARILGSPLFKAEVERLEALAEYEMTDVRQELEMRQWKAIEAIDEALACDNIKIKKETALEILDRTGYGKKGEAQKHLHLHAHQDVKEMSDEELRKEAIDLLEVE